MSTTLHHENNVLKLHAAAERARDKARLKTTEIEIELQENAKHFHALIKVAAHKAASNGSHIFTIYNRVLAAAEKDLRDAEGQLTLNKAHVAEKLAAIDHAKSVHDDFVRDIRVRTNSDLDHQAALLKCDELGLQILSVEKELRLEQDRRAVRSQIMKIETPVAWAFYEHLNSQNNAEKSLLSNLVARLTARFRGSDGFKKKSNLLSAIDQKIANLEAHLENLNTELTKVHEDVFQVSDANRELISKSLETVDNAQSEFSNVKYREDTNIINLCIQRQNLMNLRKFDHPVAEEALKQFTDIVVPAARSGKTDAIVFLMGSKRLAGNLVEAILASDRQEYDLLAELHYNQEAESLAQQEMSTQTVFLSSALK